MTGAGSQDEAIAGMDNLLATLEILRDAIWAEDKERGFEAVTVFLLQYMDLFGHDSGFVAKQFPLLEAMKNCVQSGDYENANIHVLSHLARFREARKHLQEAVNPQG